MPEGSATHRLIVYKCVTCRALIYLKQLCFVQMILKSSLSCLAENFQTKPKIKGQAQRTARILTYTGPGRRVCLHRRHRNFAKRVSGVFYFRPLTAKFALKN